MFVIEKTKEGLRVYIFLDVVVGSSLPEKPQRLKSAWVFVCLSGGRCALGFLRENILY